MSILSSGSAFSSPQPENLYDLSTILSNRRFVERSRKEVIDLFSASASPAAAWVHVAHPKLTLFARHVSQIFVPVLSVSSVGPHASPKCFLALSR